MRDIDYPAAALITVSNKERGGLAVSAGTDTLTATDWSSLAIEKSDIVGMIRSLIVSHQLQSECGHG